VENLNACPKLFLVGRPGFDYDSFLKFLDMEQESWVTIEDMSDGTPMVHQVLIAQKNERKNTPQKSSKIA
jgi:hypothetical protein